MQNILKLQRYIYIYIVATEVAAVVHYQEDFDDASGRDVEMVVHNALIFARAITPTEPGYARRKSQKLNSRLRSIR
jgi:hypothetical protein